MATHNKPLPAAYWSGAHTRHRLRYHLVWIPKYRKRQLVGPVRERLVVLLHEACEVNGWEMQELSVQPDHVHALVQVTPSVSVSDVVKCLKGGTSKALRAEFPKLVEYRWGKGFWAEGYFAESVGKIDEAVIRRYIRDQDKRAEQPPTLPL